MAGQGGDNFGALPQLTDSYPRRSYCRYSVIREYCRVHVQFLQGPDNNWLTASARITMTTCQSGIFLPTRRQRDFRVNEHKNSNTSALTDPELRELLDVTVAGGFDVDETQLRQPNRCGARIALARQVAMYLSHVACGLTKAEAGRLFARDRTTVHHACIVIEQRRDDRAFDQAIDHLERVVKIVAGPRRHSCIN